MVSKRNILIVIGIAIMSFVAALLICQLVREKTEVELTTAIKVIPTMTVTPAVTEVQSSFTEEQGRACWAKVTPQVLAGTWTYQGGIGDELGELDEAEKAFYSEGIFMKLLENGQFISRGWGGNGIDPTGEWSYAKGVITFDFYEGTVEWTAEDAQSINESFENTTLDVQAQTLTVPVGFIQRTEDFTGECDLEHFHINMMNYLLYKEAEL